MDQVSGGAILKQKTLVAKTAVSRDRSGFDSQPHICWTT